MTIANIAKLPRVVRIDKSGPKCFGESKSTAQRIDRQSLVSLAHRIQKLAQQPNAASDEVLAAALAEIRALRAEYGR
jgi:hypothetical protein